MPQDRFRVQGGVLQTWSALQLELHTFRACSGVVQAIVLLAIRVGTEVRRRRFSVSCFCSNSLYSCELRVCFCGAIGVSGRLLLCDYGYDSDLHSFYVRTFATAMFAFCTVLLLTALS